MNITRKIALLRSNDLYNTLDILEELDFLDKLGFSESPIEDCPFVKDAYYFKVSSVSFDILKYCDTYIYNLLEDTTATNDIKNKMVQAVINFKKVCEENDTIEYFVINKEPV
jgi:hypothetical protein